MTQHVPCPLGIWTRPSSEWTHSVGMCVAQRYSPLNESGTGLTWTHWFVLERGATRYCVGITSVLCAACKRAACTQAPYFLPLFLHHAPCSEGMLIQRQHQFSPHFWTPGPLSLVMLWSSETHRPIVQTCPFGFTWQRGPPLQRLGLGELYLRWPAVCHQHAARGLCWTQFDPPNLKYRLQVHQRRLRSTRRSN